MTTVNAARDTTPTDITVKIMMLLKLLWVLTAGCPALSGDPLLEALYGVTGYNKVTICGLGGAECEGALWRRQWAVARGSCIASSPLRRMLVIKTNDGMSCERLPAADPSARQVVGRAVHPSHRAGAGAGARFDVALLSLAPPFPALEPLANASAARSLFLQYEMWMNYAIQVDHVEQTTYVNPYARKSGMFASPVRMFIFTVVLPSACFIMFFIFVIFYTTPKNINKIPYFNSHSKDTTSV